MAKISKILLVEDDRTDLRIFKHTLKEVDCAASITVVHAENGAQALDSLAEDKTPDLIFMDINMPIMDGKEALIKIKSDPKLKMIPVLMLTTSVDDNDRKVCFDHGVAGYFVKEIEFDDNVELLKIIFQYWSKSQGA